MHFGCQLADTAAAAAAASVSAAAALQEDAGRSSSLSHGHPETLLQGTRRLPPGNGSVPAASPHLAIRGPYPSVKARIVATGDARFNGHARPAHHTSVTI